MLQYPFRRPLKFRVRWSDTFTMTTLAGLMGDFITQLNRSTTTRVHRSNSAGPIIAPREYAIVIRRR